MTASAPTDRAARPRRTALSIAYQVHRLRADRTLVRVIQPWARTSRRSTWERPRVRPLRRAASPRGLAAVLDLDRRGNRHVRPRATHDRRSSRASTTSMRCRTPPMATQPLIYGWGYGGGASRGHCSPRSYPEKTLALLIDGPWRLKPAPTTPGGRSQTRRGGMGQTRTHEIWAQDEHVEKTRRADLRRSPEDGTPAR